MSNFKLVDVLLVLAQLALFLLYFWQVDFYIFEIPSFIKILLLLDTIGGLLISCIATYQLDKNLSVFPSPKENGTLFQGGLYAHIRHPIYTGLLVLFFAFGFYQGSLYKICMSIIILFFFYFKSVIEERSLLKKFPEYKEYQKQTGRFLPFKINRQKK